MSIYEKLLSIQDELKAPKSQHNDFGNFNYRSSEDILEALKPLLKKYGAVLTISDDVCNIVGRFYIKATVAIRDIETDGIITSCGYAREPESRPKMDEAQVTGSSSSYARKYALNGLFCIDDTKDPDATNTGDKGAKQGSRGQKQSNNEQRQGSRQQAKKEPEQVLTPLEFHSLTQEADRKGVQHESICHRYGKKSFKELTSLEYKRAMSGLSKMPDINTDWQVADPDELPDDVPFR